MRQHAEGAVFGCAIAPWPRLARRPLASRRGYVLLVAWLGCTAEAMSLTTHDCNILALASQVGRTARARLPPLAGDTPAASRTVPRLVPHGPERVACGHLRANLISVHTTLIVQVDVLYHCIKRTRSERALAAKLCHQPSVTHLAVSVLSESDCGRSTAAVACLLSRISTKAATRTPQRSQRGRREFRVYDTRQGCRNHRTGMTAL